MPSLNFWRIAQGLNLTPKASAPSSPSNGDFYYNSTSNLFQFYQNGAFIGIGGSGDISQGGNTFGTAMTIGTNDNFNLVLERNNTAALTISTSGGLPFLSTTGKMEIAQTLGVGAGGGSAISIVNVSGNSPSSLGGDRQIAYSATHTVSSAATHADLAAVGFWSAITTAAAAFTAPVRYQFRADGNTAKGAGSTITRDINFGGITANQGTNNAFIADNQAFTGDYLIHSSSGKNSAILGGATFGSTGHNPVTGIRYTGANLTGASQFGIYSDPSFTSAATTEGRVFYGQFQTVSGSFTVGQGSAYYAHSAGLGGSSAVTRLTNYAGVNQTAGTNNAFMSDNATFSGNYFIHSTSTRASVFGGAVQFPDGASNTPSITFSSATGQGFSRIDSETVRLAAPDNVTFSIWTSGTNDNSVLDISNNGSSSGDQSIRFSENNDTADRWAIGRDDSDSGSFKISQSSALGTNDYFKVETDGDVKVQAGTSTTLVGVGGAYSVNVAEVANSGTGETDLQSFTISANTLNANGDALEFEWFGTTSGANIKTLRLYVDGVAQNTVVLPTTNSRFKAKIYIHKSTTNVVKGYADILSRDSTPTGNLLTEYIEKSVTLTSSFIVKLTGQSSAASNEIVSRGARADWKPTN